MKCLKEFITTTTQCVPYYNKTESYFYFVWKFKDFLLHYCHYEIWFSLVIQLSERTLFVIKDVSLDKFKIKKMPKQNIFADPTKRIRTIICCVVLYCILLRKYFYPTNLTYIDKIMAMNCYKLQILKSYEFQKIIILISMNEC